MTIRIINSVNDASPKGFSEDMLGYAHETAWVLDGATSASKKRLLDRLPSDAVWYTSALSGNFQKAAAKFPHHAPRRFFGSTLSSVRNQLKKQTGLDPANIDPPDLPCAAGMFMAYNRAARRSSFFGLGDCSGVALLDDGKLFTTTATPYKQSEKNRIFTDPAKTRAAYIASRWHMNKPGPNGYWIFSTEPEAARHMQTDELTLPEGVGAYVLLMSDGLDRLHENFSVPYLTIIRHAIDHGLEKIVELVREQENRHASPYDFQCTKQHDDASGLLLRIEP